MSTLQAPTVVIENFYPCLEGGRHPIKRIIGEQLDLWCDIFMDGHVVMSAVLKWRMIGAKRWFESPMKPTDNDRWQGACSFESMGRWEYAVEAWSDSFRGWKKTFAIRVQAKDPDVPIESLEGARLLREAAQRARAAGAADCGTQIEDVADLLASLPAEEVMEVLLSEDLQRLIDSYADRSQSTTSEPLRVIVEREKARFSSWYEFFPRSAEGRPDKHSTFRDCLPRLDDAKAMGFDTIYFPPIHPIGTTARKGKNNTLIAYPGDVGSPWAIGAAAGGHRSVEPQLGSIDDFVWLVGEAQKRGLEIALDFAINCSPDHPYVKDHPDWFYQRPDGSIRYAENPPKKYQDIVPFDFACPAWEALWQALLEVVLFWVGEGVKIFRVDNPHTKPFAFWEWLIAAVHRDHPDVLFLAEAFTRPKTMFRLAKLGFTQSYTYFTWRTGKEETADYLTEVTTPPLADFFRPAFWPNTPDILHATLQEGGRPMFEVRLALAALSVGTWGIYGPAMELLEATPHRPGSEEYLDSEKYQLRHRDLDAPGSLAPFIARLNQIRRDEPSFVLNRPPLVQRIDDDHLLAWVRHDPASGSMILVIVNLEPNRSRAGLLHLDRAPLGLDRAAAIQVHDLLKPADERWPVGFTPRIVCTPTQPLHVLRLTPEPLSRVR